MEDRLWVWNEASRLYSTGVFRSDRLAFVRMYIYSPVVGHVTMSMAMIVLKMIYLLTDSGQLG